MTQAIEKPNRGRRQKMKNRVHKFLLAACLGAAMGTASAAKLEDAVSKAVLTNPDVLAKLHQLNAGVYGAEVSWGRYLPTLDLVVGNGHERRESPLLTPGEHRYPIDNRSVTLRQNLFEGFATEHDTKRLQHAATVRYYELLDLSESIAQEAAKAYIDVFRYRKLLEIAEGNYAVHRLTFDKINKRAKSGVSAGVDLETAAARLALAESNLLVETSNLHDVTARYQRIVGELPKSEGDPPPGLAKGLPKNRAEAIGLGLSNSPRLKAAIENILSAQRNVSVQRASYYPRVDLYAEASRMKNEIGVLGNTRANTVGLTVSLNLFDGRRDSGRIDKTVEEVNIAKDTREQVCRELRQNLAMAYNEHLRLTEQLPYLDQHQLSTDKVREAFRRQFDIGRRTLLDVLDTENEFYTATRNYINGEADLAIAHTAYLAASGSLLKTLNLHPLEAAAPHPHTELDKDAVNSCPPDPYVEPVKVAAKADGDYAVLLENPDGTVGQIKVTGSKGERVVDTSHHFVPLDGASAAQPVDEEKLKRDFSDAIAARPPLPQQVLLYFQNNSATLTRESKALLPKVLEDIGRHPAAEVSVIGYTDTVGSLQANQALGLKRAKFVAEQLKIRQLKLQSLSIESRGKAELLVQTRDQTPEQRNRGVKITVR